MQQPTLRNVHIRTTRDALRVFNGVANNVLPLITRRLDAEERRAIEPGDVYVWEERGSEGCREELTGLGMERWTDGMSWGPSRVRDDFLYYQQKEAEVMAANPMPSEATPWAPMTYSYPISRGRAKTETERLIKQTFSVWVSLPIDRPLNLKRKWHLTAYFTQNRLDNLPTVDSIPSVGDAAVPDGLFESARAKKNRSNGPPFRFGTPLQSNVPIAPYPDHRGLVNYPGFPFSAASNASGSPPTPGALIFGPSVDSRRLSDPDRPDYIQHYATNSRPRSATPPTPPGADSTDFREPSSGPSQSARSTSPFARGSAPLSTPSTPGAYPSRTSRSQEQQQLVPLAVLQQMSHPRRDPGDERLLSRFSLNMQTSQQRTSPRGEHRNP